MKKEVRAILINIRSLHNVGSIFRTADGAGISKIYLCGITPAPLNRLGKTVEQLRKVSLGAEKNVDWEKISSAKRILIKLKEEGFEIVAVEQSAKSVPLGKLKFKNKVALVMGSETRGLNKTILQMADKILEIPMRGKKESLNVSVAFGIASYSIK